MMNRANTDANNRKTQERRLLLMKRPVYLPKWIEVMALMDSMSDRERYCQRIYRRIDISSGHIRTMMDHLERLSLVKRSPPRKTRYITLTERGRELAELALRMKFLLGDMENG